MKKYDPDTRYWESLANQLARSWAPEIYPCAECGYPVINGYCCSNCKTESSKGVSCPVCHHLPGCDCECCTEPPKELPKPEKGSKCKPTKLPKTPKIPKPLTEAQKKKRQAAADSLYGIWANLPKDVQELLMEKNH